MTQDGHDRFQFSFPVELVKAENEDEWRIRGVASTEHKDLQEEIVKQAGLDISALKSGQGLFNNDHQKGPENILGKVDYAQNTPNGLYIEGYLFKFQPRAQAYYNIMRSLKKGDKRRVQMSIEGKVLKRSENNEKIIARAKVEKIALTMDPVNAHTYAEIVKSLSVNKIELEECDDSIEGRELMKAEDGELLTYTEISSPTKASVLRRPEKGLDASSVPSPAKKIKKAKQKDYIEISKAKAFVLLEMLEKGGKKYPIGTIRHGYQKVAEGKWAPYRPGGPKREAGTIEGVPKKEVKPLVHKPLVMLAPPTEEGDKQHLQKLDVPRDFGGKIHPDVSVHKDPEKAGNWMDTTSTGHRVIARQAGREGSKDVEAFHNQKADEKETKLRGLVGGKPSEGPVKEDEDAKQKKEIKESKEALNNRQKMSPLNDLGAKIAAEEPGGAKKYQPIVDYHRGKGELTSAQHRRAAKLFEDAYDWLRPGEEEGPKLWALMEHHEEAAKEEGRADRKKEAKLKEQVKQPQGQVPSHVDIKTQIPSHQNIKEQQAKIESIDKDIKDLHFTLGSPTYSDKREQIKAKLKNLIDNRNNEVKKITDMHVSRISAAPKLESSTHSFAAKFLRGEARFERDPRRRASLEKILYHHQSDSNVELTPEEHQLASRIFHDLRRTLISTGKILPGQRGAYRKLEKLNQYHSWR